MQKKKNMKNITFEIVRTIIDRDTREERSFVQKIDKSDVICLYKDQKFVYIILENSNMVRQISHSLEELESILRD